MANTVNSANMNLPIPIVGVEVGPTWASDLNSCLSVIDAHDHSSGAGALITPSGLNINADLSFGGNNATLLKTARFSSQVAALSGASNVGCLYEVGVDLYYNDGSGNQIRLTQSGSIAGVSGTIGGLASPASASYVSGGGTFVWQSAANTAATMDHGPAIFRNTTASSFGLTLQAPTLASNYTITLPALPASTSALNITSSGTVGTISYDAIGQGMTSVGSNAIAASMNSTGTTSIIATMGASGANSIGSNMTSTGANAIGASMTSTGANAVAATRTRAVSTTVAAGGVAISATSSAFTTSSTSYVDVTGQSVTITTSGRPIMIQLCSSSGASTSYLGFTTVATFSNPTLQILRGATQVFQYDMQQYGSSKIPPSSITHIENVAAGTYTYKLQAKVVSGDTLAVNNCQLVVFEL